MLNEGLGARGKAHQARGVGADDLIPAHAIEHDHNNATHESPLQTPSGITIAFAYPRRNLDHARCSGQG